jgi:hypothetical protein
MTTEAPTDALDALSRHRNNFIEMAGAFLTGTVEAYSPIEELIRSNSKAQQSEISNLQAAHATEVRKLRLIATTATASADEKARQSSAKAMAAAEDAAAVRTQKAVADALSAAERDFAARAAQAVTAALSDAEEGVSARIAQEVADALSSAEAVTRDSIARERLQATEEANARHEEILQSLRTQHSSQIEALRQDFASQAAILRDGLESETATATQSAVAQARESLASEYEQKRAAAASDHETKMTNLVRQHNNSVSGVQTMLRAAESGRIAAEAQLAEARQAVLELESRPTAPDESASAGIAPEVDALLYPAGQPGPDESLAVELETMRTALSAANSQIGSLQSQLGQSTGDARELQAQLVEAGSTRDHLEREVRRLTQELLAVKGSPVAADPTAASMKLARAEAHAVVRLVADANPQIKLVEAADLVGAALTGRTEMAMQLPSPVLLDTAA